MQLISDKTLLDIDKSFGLDLLKEESRNNAITEIVSLISGRAGLRIIKDFNEEETREFNSIPRNDLDGMESYILAKNPRAKEIFEEEARKVKEEILKPEIKQ